MTVTGPCTSAGDDKVLLNVEVQLRPDSRADLGAVRAAALAYLASLPSVRYAEGPLCPPPGQHPLLDAHVQGLAVVDLGGSVPPGKLLLQWDVAFNVSAACACWPTAAAAPATEPHTSMVGAAQRAPLPPLHPSNRSWCSSWMARGLRTTTRARRARLRTASGCCPPQTFMGHGRRWWVPGALQGGRLSRTTRRGGQWGRPAPWAAPQPQRQRGAALWPPVSRTPPTPSLPPLCIPRSVLRERDQGAPAAIRHVGAAVCGAARQPAAHRVEPGGAAARPARHRQDLAVPGAGAEAGHPAGRQVRAGGWEAGQGRLLGRGGGRRMRCRLAPAAVAGPSPGGGAVLHVTPRCLLPLPHAGTHRAAC